MSDPYSRSECNYLYGLDLLRFFSAFIVMIFHLAFSIWANPQSSLSAMRINDYDFDGLQGLTWFGWIGVEIFFVISGLVIASSSNGRSFIEFVRSRVLRLYPAVWICSLITGVLVFFYYPTGEWVDRMTRTLLLFPLHPWIDPVYWTLAVEIVFYGWIALLILLNRFEIVPRAALVATLFSLIYQSFVFLSDNGFFQYDLRSVSLQLTRLTLLDHAAFFSLGIFIWMLNNRGRSKIVNLGITFSLFTCFLEVLNHTEYVIKSMSNSSDLIRGMFFTPLLIWIFSIAFIFFSIRYKGLFYRLPNYSLRIMKVLGQMTFPLYLLHFTCGVWLADRAITYLQISSQAALLFSILIILTFSFLVCIYIEPLVRKLTFKAWGNFELFLSRRPYLNVFFAVRKKI